MNMKQILKVDFLSKSDDVFQQIFMSSLYHSRGFIFNLLLQVDLNIVSTFGHHKHQNILRVLQTCDETTEQDYL